MPRVRQVKRAAVVAGAAQQACGAVLLGLLVAVVAGFAQALQVGPVKEHGEVAAMRFDVVNNGCHHNLA